MPQNKLKLKVEALTKIVRDLTKQLNKAIRNYHRTKEDSISFKGTSVSTLSYNTRYSLNAEEKKKQLMLKTA